MNQTEPICATTMEMAGNTVWHLTRDLAEAYSAVDPIWKTSLEEVASELDARLGVPPGYTRCLRSRDAVVVCDHPVLTTDAEDTAIVEAAKKFGTIMLVMKGLSAPVLPDNVATVCTSHPLKGKRSLPFMYSGTTVTYNPKAAQRACATKHRRDAKQPTKLKMYHDVVDRLNGCVAVVLPPEPMLGGNSITGCIDRIRSLLWVMERYYGRGSFRRLAAWQEFAADWRQRLAANEAALLRRAEGIKYMAALVDDFCSFMRLEVKRRKWPKSVRVLSEDDLVAPLLAPCRHRHG